MARIQWAQASQFNWVFDNMGGTPLMEAVAGAWSGAVTQVEADGTLRIESPLSGGGLVYYLRGVWKRTRSSPGTVSGPRPWTGT